MTFLDRGIVMLYRYSSVTFYRYLRRYLRYIGKCKVCVPDPRLATECLLTEDTWYPGWWRCTYSYSVIVCSRYFQFHLLPQHSALLHLTVVRLCPSCSAARTQASHCHQQRPSRTFATGDSFQAVLQATILLLCAQIQSLPFRAYFETIIKSFCSQFPQKILFHRLPRTFLQFIPLQNRQWFTCPPGHLGSPWGLIDTIVESRQHEYSCCPHVLAFCNLRWQLSTQWWWSQTPVHWAMAPETSPLIIYQSCC